ncbi:MAG: glycerol-3-phosphate dehydrogenase/oxidase [Burkholderiales bacterium]|nr:glycerol-3-phosphate dehydrogenase/oxidase [Burkholderiales bacterium]
MRIERDLAQLAQPFDVIVVGGGITGVNVAREAAGRGLRTLVVDKGDFGHGTSSATSKLIHGGIRYLETFEFGVVRESLRERRMLALAAPHLVHQQRFLMPAWRWSTPSTALIGAGVLLYTGLAFDRNRNMPADMRIPLPGWLSREKTLAAVPWLDAHQLQGAFAYHDTFNLHPERLLLAFLQSAVDVGAQAFNHMEAVGFMFDRDPAAGGDVAVQGLQLLDRITGERHEVRGRTVVNAAGPWMDLVLSDLGRSMGVKVNRSKGVHLLTQPVAGQAQVTDTVFARARSGHHVIVSPWQGHSFIGPTDTHVDDAPDAVRADEGDVALILGTLNDTIADGYPKLRVEDIEATTVGIRPLIVDDSKDSYTTSRRHELYDHAPSGVKNLWSIGGGKWTTGRALGVETVKALLASDALRGVPARAFDSRQATAHGAFAWAEDAQPYFDAVVRSRPTVPLDDVTRLHLARLYGTDHERILDLVEREPSLAARISDRPGRLDIAAQVAFAVTDEAACTLSDVLDRRLVIGTLGRVERAEVARVAGVMAPLRGWSAGQAAAAVEAELGRRAAIELRWRGRAGGA